MNLNLMSKSLPASLLALSLSLVPMMARGVEDAADKSDKGSEKDKVSDKEKKPTAAPDSTTQGTVEVGGQRIAYTAVAGTITVGATNEQDAQLDAQGKPVPGSEAALIKDPKDATPTAKLFYVYYAKTADSKTGSSGTGAKAEDRPVTFFYNGGPGSSTVWLHMGSLGPKHVSTPDDQHMPAAPYKMIDNAYSLLDTSDLVFVDAPGTGFGRLYGKDKEKAFWGIDQDGHAFARFIERFLGKYNRWNSPKYLFGESYGTTRSAVLSNILENEDSVDFNGVILLSQIFNFTSDIDAAAGNPGIDLPYEVGLPTYAATAFYHHKLPQQPPALTPFLKEVEDFAMGDYAHALAQGTDLSAADKQATAEKLHNYTGLPVAYLVKADLRVSGGEFEKNLLDDEGNTTGRLDTRFSGPSIDLLSQAADYDPQSSAISSAYVSLFNDYVHRDLKYGEGQKYIPELNDLGVGNTWDFKHNGNPVAVNVSADLANAMKTNPRLKVMVNGGYYDLATPFYAAIYEDKHLPISSKLSANISYAWYESGHMVYVNDASLKELHDNVAAFIRSTQGGK